MEKLIEMSACISNCNWLWARVSAKGVTLIAQNNGMEVSFNYWLSQTMEYIKWVLNGQVRKLPRLVEPVQREAGQQGLGSGLGKCVSISIWNLSF